MKILIGTTEVCGMIHDLGEEYKRTGYKVTTVASSNNKFYSHKYDIDPHNLVYTYVAHKTSSSFLARAINKCVKLFGEKAINSVNSFIIRRLLSASDCYIQIFQTSLWEEERQLKYLKGKGKKIITLFVGSEIRDYFLFKEKYNIRRWNFTEDVNYPGKEAKIRKLQIHEKYSDFIFSVPDQSILAKRPYFHLQLPLKTEKFKCNIPNRDIPVVIHAPSKPVIKGTDLIIETLNKLKDEGIKFEIKFLENLSHEMLLAELTNADILVDEVILHGPGFLSFEAMLSGCAVATKHLENSPKCFMPPVININEDTIYTQLKILLTDKELRIKMAKIGAEYALQNNSIKKVAEDIIKKKKDDMYDYYP